MKMTHKLTIAGLLVAVDIVSARFLYVFIPPVLKLVRLSPQFLAHGLCGWLLGPWWAIGSAVAGDVLGMFINGAGLSFFPGYTLNAALNGLLYALVLHKKPVSLRRCLVAVTGSVLTVSLCLGALWGAILYDRSWVEAVIISLPWRLVSIPLYTSGLYIMQKGLAGAKVPGLALK